MSLIFSTGPLVQQYLFALVTSDETSIYGSSFQHDAVSLPKLDDWFEAALAWPHPCIGLIVVLLAARSSSVKQMFLRLVLFGFGTLLLFDLGYGLVRGTLSTASIFENFIANFVGAIAAAAIAILILEVANYGFNSFEWSIWARRGIAGFLVLLGGALALCAIFYLTDFFYRPRPANIDLMADAPSYGFIVSETVPKNGRNPGSDNGQTTAAFSFLSQVKQSSSLNWRAPKHGKIEWSAKDDLASYDIEVSLFTGCGPTESDPKRPPNDTSFIVSNARNFSLSHDWGAWDTTIAAEKGYGSSELTGTDSSFFVVDPSSNGKNIDLQQIAATKSQVKYSGGAGSLDLFMIAPPAKPDEATQGTPSLHFNVDGNDHIISLRGSASDASPEETACLAVPTRQAFEAKVLDMGEVPLLGVRLVISPKLRSEGQGLSNNVVVLNGDGGWVSVKGIDPQTLDAASDKRIDMISISGNLKSVAINGSDRSPKVGDSFVAMGDQLRGSFVSGLLKISGDAELLWVNSNRANQTKWESLPIEYKMLLLAILGSVFLWISRRVSILVGRAGQLAWLKDGARPVARKSRT